MSSVDHGGLNCEILGRACPNIILRAGPLTEGVDHHAAAGVSGLVDLQTGTRESNTDDTSNLYELLQGMRETVNYSEHPRS
jgi:muramidase (phage lysozyme)